MIFDKSIKEGKLPLSCINCIEAAEYIGEEGYFTNNIVDFTMPNFKHITYLHNLYDIVNNIEEEAFQADDTEGTWYKYFLPKAWLDVKVSRAFTCEEFLSLFDQGKFHSLRHKNRPNYRDTITSIYIDEETGIPYARINGSDSGYGPEYFFKYYEYFDDNEAAKAKSLTKEEVMDKLTDDAKAANWFMYFNKGDFVELFTGLFNS